MAIQNIVGRTKYKVYEGSYIEAMPKISADGFRPLTIEEIMRAQLGGKLNFKENYGSCDATLYSSDGRVTFIRDSTHLKELGQDSELENAGLVIPADVSEVLRKENPTFTRKEIGSLLLDDEEHSKLLTKGEVMNNPIWQIYAGQDKSLLESYYEKVWGRIGKNEKEFLDKDKNGLFIIYVYEPEKRDVLFTTALLNEGNMNFFTVLTGGYFSKGPNGEHSSTNLPAIKVS